MMRAPVLSPHLPGYCLGMAVAPAAQEIYQRAEEEGRSRLFMAPLDQVATSFIAGVTIVFGIVALGVLEALVAPDLGPGVGQVVGALGFGIGLVFLVVGRTMRCPNDKSQRPTGRP